MERNKFYEKSMGLYRGVFIPRFSPFFCNSNNLIELMVVALGKSFAGRHDEKRYIYV